MTVYLKDGLRTRHEEGVTDTTDKADSQNSDKRSTRATVPFS